MFRLIHLAIIRDCTVHRVSYYFFIHYLCIKTLIGFAISVVTPSSQSVYLFAKKILGCELFLLIEFCIFYIRVELGYTRNVMKGTEYFVSL